MFKIKASEQSVEVFREMDKPLSSMMIAWIEKNLSKCSNPRVFGKSLFKKDNRFWQYRLGNYRLLAIIYDDSKLIIIININCNDSI